MLWEEDPDRPQLLREFFIERASGEDIDTKEFRAWLVRKFNHVHQNVQCLHSRKASFHIAEGILHARHVPGPIVECGCFAGGMLTKMSILADALDKEVIGFDSFKGLPHDEEFSRWMPKPGKFAEGQVLTPCFWFKGQMATPQEVAMTNIEKFGKPESVTLVPGFFEDTLDQHDVYPCFIFVDVDLTTSAWTCLKYFWDRLQGPRYYSHEFWFPSYVGVLMNRLLWARRMNVSAPEYVQFIDVPHLAYLKK